MIIGFDNNYIPKNTNDYVWKTIGMMVYINEQQEYNLHAFVSIEAILMLLFIEFNNGSKLN